MINNKLVKAIEDYILEDVDREETINELRRYKKEFPRVKDYNWYTYGNILPYYSQIRDFYIEHDCIPSENNDILLEHFKLHVRKAIDNILGEMNDYAISKDILGLWEQTVCEIRSEIKAQSTPALVYAKELCDKLEHSMCAVAGGPYSLRYSIAD